jgi:hypothetical protein
MWKNDLQHHDIQTKFHENVSDGSKVISKDEYANMLTPQVGLFSWNEWSRPVVQNNQKRIDIVNYERWRIGRNIYVVEY